MALVALGAGPVLAHQGGWDEILMVLTPVALFAALLWLANSRATRIQAERPPASAATPPADTDGEASRGNDGDEADHPPSSETT